MNEIFINTKKRIVKDVGGIKPILAVVWFSIII